MTLEELIASARERADDKVPNPYFWSDDEWTSYANDAEREACRRARLIIDSTTPSVTQILLNPSDKTYALDEHILFIRRAKLAGRSQPLRRISYRDLDERAADWESETGDPCGYVPDMDDGLFRPYPSPTDTGQVSLTVVRLPLRDMKNDLDRPEIKKHLHESLLHWMLFRAFSRPDAETLDKTKAADNLALFEQEFGKKSSAIDETWIQREHGYIEDEGIY